MPSGSGGQIAIISTNSLYRSVDSSMISAAAWTNFVSETIEHQIAELQEGAITGYKDAPPAHQGLGHGQGNLVLEPNPNALGHFLRAAFGQSSGTLLTVATSWGANSGNAQNLPAGYSARPVMQHEFVPIQSAYDAYSFLPPYGIIMYKDVGSAFVFEGAVAPSIEFQIQAGQLAKSTVEFMARNVTRAARTTSMQALRSPGGRPWVWDMTSIQVGSDAGLAAKTNYESMTIKFETPIEGVLLLDGTKKYGEFQVNGFRSVNLQGTVSFRDQTEYDKFVSYENQFMRVTFTNNNSLLVLGNPSSSWAYQLQIDIPQLKYLTWSTPIAGPNRLVTQFTARAELDQTSLYMIYAKLINTTSSYT